MRKFGIRNVEWGIRKKRKPGEIRAGQIFYSAFGIPHSAFESVVDSPTGIEYE